MISESSIKTINYLDVYKDVNNQNETKLDTCVHSPKVF